MENLKTFNSNNIIEFKKIESLIFNAELNLKLKSLFKESHDNYLKLEFIRNELNQIDNEIIQIRQEIEQLENNIKGLNNNCINYDFNIIKLEKHKQYLKKNLKIIQKSLNEKQTEHSNIKNKINSIREGLKEEILKKNLLLKGNMFTESSKMLTLELELTHLKREEDFYYEKIEDIDRIITLNSNNNINKNSNTSEIKQKLILYQEKLIEKERAIKKHEITRINLESLMNQIKQKLLNSN